MGRWTCVLISLCLVSLTTAQGQTAKRLDLSSLIGRAGPQVQAVLGKPAKVIAKNKDGVPEWQFKLKDFSWFSLAFEGKKVTSIEGAFKNSALSPEASLGVIGLNPREWTLDTQLSNTMSKVFKRGNLYTYLNSWNKSLGFQIIRS